MVPQAQQSSVIAGAVLPIKRAEELLHTLPGVLAARIIAGETGVVEEIHVLTTSEVTPKQTVRNIESALIAHLGMRIDHRKISVATTLEPPRESAGAGVAPTAVRGPQVVPSAPEAKDQGPTEGRAGAVALDRAPGPVAAGGRDLYFEDVEVRRSRARGISCRVTLVRGDKSYVGEAEGMENERSRLELAARAALRAVMEASPAAGPLDLAGVRVVEAFDREFVFLGVTAQLARESVLLTGTCEVRDSSETASVLAVLDATNRWLTHPRRAAG
jgi:hypothetical protein